MTGPFFFLKLTITSYVFLDVTPQTEDDPDLIVQLGGVTPYFCLGICEGLTDSFPGRREWKNVRFLGHLHRSPRPNPEDFYWWGYSGNVSGQRKATNLTDLKARIREAVACVTPEMD